MRRPAGCAPSGASWRAERGLRVALYPALDGSPEAAAALCRARWMLGALPGASLVHAGPPPSVPPRMATDGLPVPARADGRGALALAREADRVVCWSKPGFLEAPAWLRRRAVLDDPLCDPDNPASSMAAITGLAGGPPDDGAALTALLSAAREAGRRALIVGSGPGGVDDALAFARRQRVPPFVIAIGGCISDPRLGGDLPVDLILAWDAAGQLGPSVTAQRARGRMRRIQETCGAAVVAPAALCAPFRAAFAGESLAIPGGFDAGGPLAVGATRNVLTSAALPLAAALGGPVRTAGVTLSRPAAPVTGWWAHDREADHHRDIADMIAVHPAFGMNAAAGYFDRHHACLSRQLAQAAAAGIAVVPAGPPSPVRLGADAPEPSDPDRGRVRTAAVSALVAAADAACLRPGLAAMAVFILCVPPALMLMSVLMTEIALALLAAAGLAALAAGLLALRARSERSAARLERRLAVQQARQFENLTARLDALEERVERSSGSEDLNNRH
jgi:hypothetical protein